MRLPAVSLALASTLLLAGCSNLVSLNPFVTEKQAVTDPALSGIWASADGKDLYSIRDTQDGYDIRFTTDSGESVKFKARLMVAGEVKLLDLIAADENPFQLQVHTPVRVWTDGSTMRMTFLDSGWLREQAAKQIATTPAGDRTLIVAPSDVVREFFLKTGSDAKSYGDPSVLRRLQ